MSTRLATLLLCLVPLASCVSTEDLAQARSQEIRAEIILADAEAMPEGTPGRDELIADARAQESELERIRESLEALDRDSLIGSGIDVATKSARGNYLGALDALVGLALAAGTLLLARRGSKTETQEQLADLERRRDESRAHQGIAGASERSAVQVESAAARAARFTKRAEQEQWLAVRRTSTGHSGSIAPLTDLGAALNDLEVGLN